MMQHSNHNETRELRAGGMKMKRLAFLLAAVAVVLWTTAQETSGRGRGGGGRGGGGGGRGGGGGGAVRSSGVSGQFSGGGSAVRSGQSVVGAGGGSLQTGKGGGSYTTKGGSTINYGGAGAKASGPGGGTAGRGVGGVQVTTPGGKTATKVGTAGGAVGPGGVAVGGKKSVGAVSGPGGSAVGVSGSRTAIGPGGAVTGGYKGGVAVGAHGAAAVGGTRYGAATGRYGTQYVSRSAMVTQSGYVRTNFNHYNCFNPGWNARYPGAWYAAGWVGARAWTAATWGAVASYCSYLAEPVYYDYGSTVVYQGDTVYINGEEAASAEVYSKQATQIADTGREAKVSDKEDWQPLGVFAMIQGDEKTSYKIFQLALNKQGVIRGNYYDALADSTTPVYGSVDAKTQRAAWSIGDKKSVVFEAGVANLTQEQSPLLVHFGADNTQQFTLVRVEQPEEKK
jgi:hypothetical protein